MQRTKLSFDDAVRLQAALERESELEGELTEYVGVFTIVNTETSPQSWGFRPEAGSSLRGEVDPTKDVTIAGVPPLTAKYKIWCDERIIEEASGRIHKVTKLYDLRPWDQPVDVLDKDE